MMWYRYIALGVTSTYDCSHDQQQELWLGVVGKECGSSGVKDLMLH